MIAPRPLARLIAKLFARPSWRDRRRAARLGCERLEGRDVPAGVFTITALADATEGGAAGGVRVSYTGDPSDGSAYLVQTGGTADPWSDLADSGWASYFSVPANGYTDIPLDAFDDATFEGAETLTFEVVAYSAGSTVGSPGSATITIHDNEPPATVSVARVADAVEGGADGTFRFTRTGGDLGQSLVVSYTVETTSTGAATPTADYTALSGTVTFAPYAGTADVTVDAGTDGLIEDAEWVALAIDEDSDYEIGSAEWAVVTIRDQTREVSVAGVQDAEEGGADGILRFTRTGDLSETLTVTYTVATTGPSLATPTAGYTALTGSVTFAANSATADVLVVTTDDLVHENDEVVIVTIAAASTYTIGTGTGQVWIEDDDGGVMIWVAPSAGDWWTASNWLANRVPVSTDDLYFIGSYSQQHMTTLGSLPLTYAGLHVASDYIGTISLTAPVSVGTLTMAAMGGVIDQPNGSGSNLTITSRLDWTGGTINASSTPSTVTVYGAMAQITTAATASVTLGSALVFEAAAAAQVEAQVNLLHPTGIDVLGGSQLVFGPGTAILSAIQAIEERQTIRVFGEHSRLFSRGAVTARLGLWVGGGTVELQGNPTDELLVNFLGPVRQADGVAPATGYTNVSVYMTGGKLIIGEGAVLVTAERAVVVRGGKLATRATAGIGRHEALIVADYMVVEQATGATTEIVIADSSLNPPGPNVYGKLRVSGTVQWMTGTYRPLVHPDGTGLSSQWIAGQDFKFGDPVIFTGWPVLGPTTGQQPPPANSQYEIIKADGGSLFRYRSPLADFEAANSNWTILPAPGGGMPDKVLSIKRT